MNDEIWSQSRECIAAGNFLLHEIENFRALLFAGPFSSGCREWAASVCVCVCCVSTFCHFVCWNNNKAGSGRQKVYLQRRKEIRHTRSSEAHAPIHFALQPNSMAKWSEIDGGGVTRTPGWGETYLQIFVFIQMYDIFFSGSSVRSFAAAFFVCLCHWKSKWFVFRFARPSTCYAHSQFRVDMTREYAGIIYSWFLRHRINYAEYLIKWLRSIASCARASVLNLNYYHQIRDARAKFNLNSIIIH